MTAGGQIQWAGNGFRLEVVQGALTVDVDIDGQARNTMDDIHFRRVGG
jgi:hypothetical protein